MNLTNEIRLLYKAEAEFQLPSSAPIIRQLDAWANQPLPDHIPAPPEFVTFHWPAGGSVDYRDEWARVDRRY
jgi:hypothetical protein